MVISVCWVKALPGVTPVTVTATVKLLGFMFLLGGVAIATQTPRSTLRDPG